MRRRGVGSSAEEKLLDQEDVEGDDHRRQRTGEG
jgi:hypothetical protein